MAKKQPVNLDSHIVQWHDLTPEGRGVIEKNMRSVGMSMPERVQAGIEHMKGSTAKKAEATRTSLEAIQPHVTREPVSLGRAAGHRSRLYTDAVVRRQQEGNSNNVIPAGADWYFEHHARLSVAAEKQGHDPQRARVGSALMSPQNSPENERAAMRAIGHAHAEGKVEITPEVAAHLSKHGIDVSKHVGSVQHVRDLPSGTIGALSSADMRDKVNTNVDLKNVARGGVKANVTKAEKVLRGEADPHESFVNSKGAISGAKIASYKSNIDAAVPGSATHVEFMGRVHHDAMIRAGQIHPDQQALDLYGFGSQKLPDDHLLSPRSHSVEDTWMNAVTFNQPKKSVSTGPNPTSVFKAGGSGAQYSPSGLKTLRDENNKKVGSAHPDARMEDSMALHAFNNRATQIAAQRHGVAPTAMQSVVWTEARRQAGKSRDSASSEAGDRDLSPAEAKEQVDVYHRMGRMAPQRPALPQKPDNNRGQGTLF